jgi:hypothetical protein
MQLGKLMIVSGYKASAATRREENRMQNMGDELLKMNKWTQFFEQKEKWKHKDEMMHKCT